MPWRAAWRTSPALYCAPLLVALLWYQLQVAMPWRFDATWVAAYSRPAAALFLIVTVAAGCAAWDASRLRRGGLAGSVPVRSPLRVLSASALPALSLGMIGVAAGLVPTLPQTIGAPGWFDVRPLLVAVAAVAGHTLLGTALGWLLPIYVSMPLVLVGTYLWQVYPAAMEPVWLRHLVGYGWEYCCQVWAVPDNRLFWVSLIVPIGLAGAALLLLAFRWIIPRLLLAIVIAGATTMSAAQLASGLDVDPTVPRTGAMVCEPGEPTVCVWPENVELLAPVSAQATSIADDLGAYGVAVPGRLTERTADTRAADWTFQTSRDAEPEQLRRIIVLGLVPQVPECAESTGMLPEGTVRAQELAWAWLWSATGGDPSDFPHPDPFEQRTRVMDTVQLLPTHEQAHWYRHLRNAVLTCDASPELEPSA